MPGPRVPAWEAFVRKRPKPFTFVAIQRPIWDSQQQTFRFSSSCRPAPIVHLISGKYPILTRSRRSI